MEHLLHEFASVPAVSAPVQLEQHDENSAQAMYEQRARAIAQKARDHATTNRAALTGIVCCYPRMSLVQTFTCLLWIDVYNNFFFAKV